MIEIDQSGKVEDTNKLTVVAFSNGKIKSLQISAREKQKLVKAMRGIDHPKQVFIFKIFACLIFLLINSEKEEYITIDKEYPGHEAIIKGMILSLFYKIKNKAPDIMFAEIGKKSMAHKTAIAIFRKERKADIIIRADDIIKLLYK
ncbi:MAG: hypothetical protein V1860_03995 [bacterium]